jgi:ApbE superfamily uncharacterized protein (UPF0280 family)
LEEVKGNSFTAMQIDYLNQIAQDASIKIECDNEENVRLIDNLVKEEKNKQNQFLDENPDVMSPVNLYVELDLQGEIDLDARE